jgi:hypothetical protein
VELKLTYDAYPKDKEAVYDESAQICGIGDNFSANRTCLVNFTAPRDMAPPILIHYELTNFHQNHRNYYRSRDPYQLLGKVGNQDPISATDCEPLNKLGNITLNPCGLTANTLFNDYFVLESGTDANGQPLIMREDGIAWRSDVKYMYAQPDGFNYSQCDSCDDPNCCSPGDSCTTPYYDKTQDACFRYYYPEDDTTQYLYETYPDIISPLDGVTNEHFIVWMRVGKKRNGTCTDVLCLFLTLVLSHTTGISKVVWLDRPTHTARNSSDI